jgi:hypothetical protein
MPFLFYFFFFLFLLFFYWTACWLCKKSYQPFNVFFLLIQSPVSYLLLFYLHRLFLIRFYFWFYPRSFDFFFNLFSNLFFIFLIAICFVLNHFLDWFVFFLNSTTRHLFWFIFYVKFDPNFLNCYFLIIFLKDFLFFNFIHKHLISFDFYVESSPNFFNCYFFVLHFCLCLCFSLSIASFNICLIKNLASLFF